MRKPASVQAMLADSFGEILDISYQKNELDTISINTLIVDFHLLDFVDIFVCSINACG
jgi:hypothetical protein